MTRMMIMINSNHSTPYKPNFFQGSWSYLFLFMIWNGDAEPHLSSQVRYKRVLETSGQAAQNAHGSTKEHGYVGLNTNNAELKYLLLGA